MIKALDRLCPTVILILLIFYTSCTQIVDLRINKSSSNNIYSTIYVGDHISIRKIERLENDIYNSIYTGYLGRGDKINLSPGDYKFTTKIEFDETVEQTPNKLTTMTIRTSSFNTIHTSIQGMRSYIIFNRFEQQGLMKPVFIEQPNAPAVP